MTELNQSFFFINNFVTIIISSTAFVHGNLSLFVANSRVRIVVFNATFNNISVISWQSVLLVEVTGVPGDNHRVASH